MTIWNDPHRAYPGDDYIDWITLNIMYQDKKVTALLQFLVDGESFELLHEFFPSNDFSFTQDIFEFNHSMDEIASRYVRVRGYNINSCPNYHPGAGKPSWIFADEIIVR